MATSGVTPLTFTGTSPYSASFQGVLTRAVGIASIPLQILQSRDQTILSQETQLASLQGTTAGLTSAVKALGDLGANQAISASSSDSSLVTVATTAATAPASYTINSITSLASAASETSLIAYSDSASTPVSPGGVMDLVLGTTHIPINLTSSTNNLVGLVNAINLAGAGVSATILTTGTGVNYLSLSAVNSGQTTLQLNDDPLGANTNVMTSANQGTNAIFSLNNLPVIRSSNTINDLISGATLTLQAKTTTPATITLASDSTQLASGISTFVNGYNASLSQINSQAGLGTGVLSGDSVIFQLEGDMKQIANYQGSGEVKSLSDMGITFASDGSMSVDPTVIAGFSSAQLAGAFQFFGSETSGFGAISQTLDQVSNATSGAIATEQTSLQNANIGLQTQITNMEANINAMQKTLFQQLANSDTLISSLDTQQSILTASIQSLDYTLYGKQLNSSS